jgi:chromosomal replication initiation ATPase DnaA
MREFANAAELIAHYKTVRARLNALKPPASKPAPVKPHEPPTKIAHALILHAIVRAIEQNYGVEHGVLKRTVRTAKTVEPRQMAYYLLREIGGASLKKIGVLFERDHSTVKHGIQRVSERVQTDEVYAARVAMITQQIQQRTEA